MMYATVQDVESGFRTLSDDEKSRCAALLEEASAIIDAYASNSVDEQKKIVSCRMIRRVLGDSNNPMYPMGASQGSASALGYSQSWTLTGGTSGELYLSKLEKKLLGCGDKIGARSPTEDLCNDYGY